jgi:hypothetical protein
MDRSKIRVSAEKIALLVIPSFLLGGVVIGRNIYHQGFYLDELLDPLGWLVLTIGCGVLAFRRARMVWGINTRWTTRLKLALCWLGLFGLYAVLLYPIMTMPMGARNVPRIEPSEANRVFHPSGFSIIPPPDWQIRIYTNSEPADLRGSVIAMTPGDRSRHSPGLGAYLWFRPDDLTNYLETTFRGRPAFEKTSVGIGSKCDRLSYQLFVPDGTNWFRLGYSECACPGSDSPSNFPPIIRRYIESFRLPGETNVTAGSAGKLQ